MNILQEKIAQHLEERGWGISPPGDYVKSMAIEVGELLEHFQWSNPTAEELKNDPARREEIGHEMADVVIYALELCIVLGLDFEKTVLEKLAIAQKKYPVEKVLGKREDWHKIHEEHRQNKTEA